jgi:hypothetical protein
MAICHSTQTPVYDRSSGEDVLYRPPLMRPTTDARLDLSLHRELIYIFVEETMDLGHRVSEQISRAMSGPRSAVCPWVRFTDLADRLALLNARFFSLSFYEEGVA